MKKVIAAVVVIVLLIVAWFYLAPRQGGVVPLPVDTSATNPWIEVESNEVARIDKSGSVLGIFATGDIIEEGATISTNASGTANIYFADGSTLRIESNTKLTITESSFEEESSSLKVKVALSVGKVWSKITALASPESHWEVNTGTAVATVRGSAFGTEITKDGETFIVGSEHDVFVAPLDPETGDLIADAEVVVGEKEILSFKKEAIQKIKDIKREERKEKATKILVREARDADKHKSSWIKENEKHDSIIREKVKELKDRGLESKELRKEVRSFLKQELRSRIKNEDKGAEEVKVGENPDRVINKAERRIEKRIIEEGIEVDKNFDSKPKAKINGLRINKHTDGLIFTEGALVELEAVLIMSDGSTKVVTDQVDWQVVGSIGRMQNPGVFKAVLGNDVSEIGTAFGAVTARFVGEPGNEYINKTDIFTVIGKIDKIDERG